MITLKFEIRNKNNVWLFVGNLSSLTLSHEGGIAIILKGDENHL